MTISNIILDFDGTLTDVYAEAHSFEMEWRRLFAESVGLREDTLSMLVESLEPQIAADPTKGWEHNGQIVAPATADPYITTTVVYQEILDGLRLGRIKWPHKELPSTMEDMDNFFEQMFRAAYAAQRETVFRPGAKEFLDEVVNKYTVFIVTNSDENKVIEKVTTLGHLFGDKRKEIMVLGNARKYINNPEFGKVPSSMRIDGLDRDILLRREHYFKNLNDLRIMSGFDPHNTAIIGDIFELDLAMPSQMGYFTLQMETQGTQPHERRYHQHHLRSCLVSDFEDALRCLGE